MSHLSTSISKQMRPGLTVVSKVAPSSSQNPRQGWSFINPGTWTQWNGNHRRLQNTESPCISTSTTATNLSCLADSNSAINQKKMNKDANIRVAAQEIEPLQKVKVEAPVPEEEEEPFDLTFKNIKTQLFAAIAVSWVSLIIGYSTAYTAPAEYSLRRDFGFNDNEISWISSFMPLGALLGGLGGGTLIEFIGRKWSIMLTNVCFLVSWLLCYCASSYLYLYIGRIIIGLSVGVASLTLPVYTAESLQPEVRGSLGLLPTGLGNLGVLICFTLGAFYEWQVLALVGALVSIPFLVMIWFIPETPKFLLGKGKLDKAKSSLQWLRGKNSDIGKEFTDLQRIQQESNELNATLLDLFSKKNMKLIVVALGLMFFQQFSGINAVIFYTTTIFEYAGSSLDKKYCTIIVGVVNFGSSFIAAMLIDRLGRKVLLYISSISMIVSLNVLGIYFYLKDVAHTDISAIGWLPLVSFMVYVLGFSLGYGPIPWLMMGEIFPAKIRGPAASLATAFNWTCTFIVTKTFLLIRDGIGTHYTFWMYGIIVTLSLFFVFVFVPETRGISLADIERRLTGIRTTRRISSVANLKPLPSTIG
ncbi:facilitated trehalose transporter Tret1-2 homolog isoform X1 [Diabrotica virgifera virgifera]|uniref:Major facilitator superfamily (MFS) profile domain-containing protein n=2 Tax=Diabrotica virgifera virgifera TaxID=50390 RepID=A0ABM5IVI6_DIAVI|nr:facilitated trehalose transporter Tret1-2 homolog isoform X1 [Diabrotica virgifera virgifera]